MTRQPGKHFKPEPVLGPEFEPDYVPRKPDAADAAGQQGADAPKAAADSAAAAAATEPATELAARASTGDDGGSAADEEPASGDASPSESEPDADRASDKLPSLDDVVVRKRVGKRKGRVLKRVAIVLACVVLLLAGAAGGAYLYFNHSVEQGKEQLLKVSKKKVDTDVVEFDGKKYKRNTDIVTIAILGFDTTTERAQEGYAGQADAIMVVAINTKTGETKVIAVPRDSMVAVDRYVDGQYVGQNIEQLCLAFSYGDGGPTSSQYTVDAVSRTLLNTPISYYFSIDMTGIPAINDSVGGITLTPVESVPKAGIYAGKEVTLLGQKAFDYLHWRDTSVTDSPQTRQRRQEQYLKAFAQKLLANAKGGDISSFVNLYNTAMPYSVTNLGFDEFSYLATTVAQHGIGDIDVAPLTGTMTAGPQYAEFHLDENSVKQTVLDVFYTQVDNS